MSEVKEASWNDVAVTDQAPEVPKVNSEINGRLKIGVIGKNYLADAMRVAFDSKITEVNQIETSETLDDLIEWKPNIVFICTDIPLLKNDTLDDAEFVNNVVKIAKQTPAGVCVKTTINNETLERIVGGVGVEWFSKKLVYSPEVAETAEEVLNGRYMLLGGSETAIDALQKVLKTHTYFSMKDVVTGTLETISYAKLGLAGFKAIKQTYFNQLHNAILDMGGANPTHVRRIIESHPDYLDPSLSIPTFIRSALDSGVTLKQAKSYGGEYANSDVKMLSSMTERLTLLDECINLRNVKD